MKFVDDDDDDDLETDSQHCDCCFKCFLCILVQLGTETRMVELASPRFGLIRRQ